MKIILYAAINVVIALTVKGTVDVLTVMNQGMNQKPLGTPITPPNCPQDYVLQGKRCFKQEFAEPILSCPAGSTLVRDGCERYADYIYNCRPGTTYVPDPRGLSEGVCVQERTAPKVPICQPEYKMATRDGHPVCQRVVVTSSTVSCRENTLMHDSCCWEPTEYKPELVCNGGEYIEGGSCIREESYDCRGERSGQLAMVRSSGDVGKLKCMKKFKRTAELRCGTGKMINDMCVREEPEPVQYECPGIIDVESVCKHLVTATPDWTCPPRFKTDHNVPRGVGSRCVAYEEVPPIPCCPEGYADVEGRCLMLFPPAVSCSGKFNFDGGKCVHTCYTEARLIFIPVVQTCTNC